MRTAAFTTLGCKLNQYETQRILDDFVRAGFTVVPFDTPADVYVVNTCSVTGAAEAKSRYTVRRAARTNPESKTVVTGCAAQMAHNQGTAFEGADVVVPNPEKLDTLGHVLRAFPGLAEGLSPGSAPRPPGGRTRATLKVQDGCSVMCSFCSIPFTRPGMVSRPADEVLAEARRFGELGYHEIVLTGVLIGAYGPATGSGGPDFEALVERLAAESGIARIRVSSIEMHQVTPRLIALARAGRIVPHFHIPLQAGDDAVLRDMGRRYDQAAYLDLCDQLRSEVPGVALTTDVLVGFPTESAERFEGSVRVFERAKFRKAHVFRFSPRPGTPAERWGDPVPDRDKQERSARLTGIAERTGREQVQALVGRTLRVLIEGRPRRDGLLEGTADDGTTVRLAGPETMARTLQWATIGAEVGGVAFGELAAGPGRLSLTPQKKTTPPSGPAERGREGLRSRA